MKKLRLLAILLALIALACSFSGCLGKRKYNVRLEIIPRILIHSEFEKANRIRTNYPNENYREGEDVPSHIYYEDEPRTRTFIIRDKETYDNIFTDESLLVDFDKETIVLYVFSRINSRKIYLDKVTVNGGQIKIVFREAYSDLYDTSEPGVEYMVVKMEKTDVTEVEFVEKRY